MKLALKHTGYCDGCANLEELNTLGQHKRCKAYKKTMLPKDDVFLGNNYQGYLVRLEQCKKDNEAVVKK